MNNEVLDWIISILGQFYGVHRNECLFKQGSLRHGMVRLCPRECSEGKHENI